MSRDESNATTPRAVRVMPVLGPHGFAVPDPGLLQAEIQAAMAIPPPSIQVILVAEANQSSTGSYFRDQDNINI